MLGVGTLFYGLVTVTEVFVAGHLADLLAERRTLKAIEATSDHYIICGFGRVGRQVARDLRAAGRALRRHRRAAREPRARRRGRRALHRGRGDRGRGPARGGDHARARRSSRAWTPTPTTSSSRSRARELRPDIAIVARAASEDVGVQAAARGRDARDLAVQVQRHRRWRAWRSTRRSPAWSTSRPSTAWRRSRSRGAARARASPIADVRGGAIIVGVRSADGTFHPQPPAETVLNAGDVVMAMGTLRTDAAPRGPVRARAHGVALVTPVTDLRAAVEAAAAGLANGGVDEVAAHARAPQAGRSRRLRDQRGARARAACSRRRRARSPSGWAARCATASARRSSASRSPGPGFLNLFLADPWYVGALDWVLAAGDGYGGGGAAPALRVNVEFVSANPTGPADRGQRPPCRLRRRARARARLRRPRRRARVLLQRRRDPDREARRVDPRAGARRGGPRGRLRRRLRQRAGRRRSPARPSWTPTSSRASASS